MQPPAIFQSWQQQTPRPSAQERAATSQYTQTTPAGFKTATKDAYSALADFESGKEEYSVAAIDYVATALAQPPAAAAPGGGT